MSSADYRRLESPTSILTYMQCPRKYYYRYVERLEQKPSIHLVIGDLVHSTIASFHNSDISHMPTERFFQVLYARMMEDFRSRWDEKRRQLNSLGLELEEETTFHDEARIMLDNFYQHHINRVVAYQYRHGVSLEEAFKRLRPKTETKIVSERYGIMGVVDAIHDFDGKITIIDYKTSKNGEINDECLTQLALYALLYKESFGRAPDMVGIHFLRYGEKILCVSPELLVLGEDACRRIQALTRTEDVTGFPQRFFGLCKFRSGQCDYYDACTPWNSLNPLTEPVE